MPSHTLVLMYFYSEPGLFNADALFEDAEADRQLNLLRQPLGQTLPWIISFANFNLQRAESIPPAPIFIGR